MDFEVVAEGLQFPEGPIAMADGSVILTEIKARRLSHVTPDGKRFFVVGSDYVWPRATGEVITTYIVAQRGDKEEWHMATAKSAEDASAEISKELHKALREEKPAYRAAKGAMPPTRRRKPAMLRVRKSQAATEAISASTIPLCKRVPGKTAGNRKPSENRLDCGKPKPSGSRKAPCTR